MNTETEMHCMVCGEEWVCYEGNCAKALEHIRKGKQ